MHASLWFAAYPSLGKKSVTTFAAKDLPAGFRIKMPLYGHWFAIDINNQYLAAVEQINSNKEDITVWDSTFKLSDLKKCCEGIQRTIDAYVKRDDPSTYLSASRGLWASQSLRSSEISYTAGFSHFFGAITFPDPYTGAMLHQMPTRKQEGRPEMADGYAAAVLNGYISSPVASYDTKLEDWSHSDRTTVCHSVNLTQVNNEYGDWPILIGLPNTPSIFSIQVHVPVTHAMWTFPAVNGPPTNLAIICAGAIRMLCAKEYCTSEYCSSDPITHMMPTNTPMSPLGLDQCREVKECRVYLDGDNIVHKYYSVADRRIYNPNIKVIQKYGTLTKVSLKNVKNLHRDRYVHGDIRACNIIFTDDSSHLIDYDLAMGGNNPRYPSEYNYLENERHEQAKRGAIMQKIHDRVALSKMIKKALSFDNTIAKICKSLEDANIDLESIIKMAKSKETCFCFFHLF